MKWTIVARVAVLFIIFSHLPLFARCTKIHLHMARLSHFYVIARKKIDSSFPIHIYTRQLWKSFSLCVSPLFFPAMSKDGETAIKCPSQNTVSVLIKFNRTHFIKLCLIAFGDVFWSPIFIMDSWSKARWLDWIKFDSINFDSKSWRSVWLSC